MDLAVARLPNSWATAALALLLRGVARGSRADAAAEPMQPAIR